MPFSMPIISALIIAILLWWFSTGLILLAARAQARGAMLGVFTLIALVGFAGVYASAGSADIAGAYLGFLGALGVWAWHEASFALGLVTGPRKEPCSADLQGWRRFKAGFMALRDHEGALLISAVIIGVLGWGADNQTALWTFLVLWCMRVSAKLSVFLGAPHGVSALVPDRLHYLTTYFRTDRLSLIPVIGVGAGIAALLVLMDQGIGLNGPAGDVAIALIGTLLALAILEHLFLVLPVSEAVLWTWAFVALDRVPQGTPPHLKGRPAPRPPANKKGAAAPL
ncbi:MAG: putative photosynthetic complex assembly protein PuhE [Pseudomonadota bacterium]